MTGKLYAETPHVNTLLAQGGNLFKRGNRIPGCDRITDLKQVSPVCDACHTAYQRFIYLIIHTGAGVEYRQCITHGTIGQAANQLCSVFVQIDFFLPGYIKQAFSNVICRDTGEIVPLTAAQDRDRDLLNLGRCQNEDDMLGRLLHRFQQCIEGCRGEHVDLVNDIDLVLADRGQIRHLVPQVADIVNAVVGGSVHLDDVHDSAGVDTLADLTFAAGVRAGGIQTVDRLGEDLGAGRFAGAAGAGEQIRMADAARCDLVLQGCDDGCLADNICKALGAPFAV